MDKSVHSLEQKVLEEFLRELRQKAGMTQSQLAKKLNVHQTQVSHWELGEIMLDLPQLRQVVTALEIDLLTFVAEYEKRLK